MDVIFDWNLGNMIYNGLITLRLCGFPFAEIRSLHRLWKRSHVIDSPDIEEFGLEVVGEWHGIS